MAAIMSKSLENRILDTLEDVGPVTPDEFAREYYENPNPRQHRACKKALRHLARRGLVESEDGKVRASR